MLFNLLRKKNSKVVKELITKTEQDIKEIQEIKSNISEMEKQLLKLKQQMK